VRLSHRQLRDKVIRCLDASGLGDPVLDARRIIEQATGLTGAELMAALDDAPNERAVRAVDQMVARRIRGEPLQYVLGRWGFRSLDLMVDHRVLIPRPETEVVASHAMAALAGSDRALAVDLGTGSGAIALAIAAEMWPHVEVWATDSSADALAVARANLAGLGRRAAAVRLVEGDWFAALPDELRGRVDLIVSNPPYVAETEPLPQEVASWEPRAALVPGATGLEAIERIITGAPAWLAPGGTLVVEIGETQGSAASRLAESCGLASVEVRPDMAGRDRVLVARARA
jgi:release factor glutamine methyltransferase